jgi:hypothetical protein
MKCIVIEGTALLIFERQCPFTIVARKYSDSTTSQQIFANNLQYKQIMIYTALEINKKPD